MRWTRLRHWKRACWLAGMLAGVNACCAGASVPSDPAKEFRITGVAVSSRDGSPVPFCRISALSIAGGTQAATQAPTQRPGQGPVPGQRGGGGPGGFPRFDNARPGQRSGSAGRGSAQGQDGEVIADDSGRFTLALAHAGMWRLVGSARGYHTQTYEEHESFYTGIVLTAASPARAVTFRMAPDATIMGLVLDEAGEPVRQAQVAGIRLPHAAPGQTEVAGTARFNSVENAMTDDRGRYELSGLAPGDYRVRVQAQPWYSSSMRGNAGGIRIISGSGIGGQAGFAAQPNAVAQTAAVSQPQDPSLDVVYATTWYPAAGSEDGAETVSLTGGEERQADFHLTAIPSVHLQVPHLQAAAPAENGRPRPQRAATVMRVSGDGMSTPVNFSGGNASTWDFGGLTPGTYEIHLPGPDGQSEGEVRQFEVKPGAAGTMTLEESKALTRVAIAIEGVPEEEVALVEFVDPDTGRRIVSTPPPRGRRGRRGGDDDADDEDDPVRTAMLPPHRYEVTLSGRAGDYLTGMSATGAQVSGSTVAISGGAPTLVLHVANARAEVVGFARKGEEAAEGAMVLLVPVTLGQPGDFSAVLRAQTNTDGSFSFHSVVPGKYILAAIDHGWSVNWRNSDTLTEYLTRGKALELRPSSKLNEIISAQSP